MKKVRLTEADLTRLIRRVIQEQASPFAPQLPLNRQASPQPPKPGSIPQLPSNNQRGPGGKPQSQINNQRGPYCRIGQSKGIIKQHTVAIGGPNATFGETGFGLFDDSGKLICKISTKYTQGGTVATPTK